MMAEESLPHKEIDNQKDYNTPCQWAFNCSDLSCDECPAMNNYELMTLDEAINFFNDNGIKTKKCGLTLFR